MNKTKSETLEANRQIRRELGRHSVDCGEVQVNVSHGTIRLNGRVRPLRGHEENFHEALGNMLKALRQRQGVRDVITEWTMVI